MIRTTLLLSALAIAAAPALSAEEAKPVYPFDSPATALAWRTVNDNVMGGRSKGGFSRVNGTLLFAGSTNTNGGGFSSIRAALASPIDLRGAEGIALRVRGDGRTYTFMVNTRARFRRSVVWYRASFATTKDKWIEVKIPLADLRPQWRGMRLSGPALDLQSIGGMGLMIYDKKDGPFRLEVERVHAYPAQKLFSLTDLKWKKRPLLVFAPNANVLQAKSQLAQLADATEGMKARDMELIVVLEKGDSAVGGERLHPKAAVTLRSRFRVEAGTFSVRLIGKDGGTKYVERMPVSPKTLFALIDEMPMRKREMEGQGQR